MLSLLRWGLGSGNDPLTDKERIKAAEKQHHAATAGRAKMANVPQNKRKRTNTLVNGAAPSGARAKQAKRSGNSVPKSLRDDDESHAPHVPSHHESRQNFIDELMASVHGITPPFRPPVPDAPPVATALPAAQAAPAPAQSEAEPSRPILEEPPKTQVAKTPDIASVQQLIEEQFSLEILLKHRELRLIDQEIAKCQVALEQLRRCRAIPFPSQSGNAMDMLNVSGGIGQPLRTRHSRQPTQPTPWGIAEGPYSRHYSQWLIPDPDFDGGASEDYRALSYRGSKGVLDRQTRGGKTELKPRSYRHGLDSARFQALPSGYPPAKEEKGIAILKRHSDGKMVKLYCGICNRDDFSSPQGFINHYRIAHDKNLKSHEQAAQVCGVELGDNELAPSSGAPGTAGGAQAPAASMVHAFNRPMAHIPSTPSVPMLSMPVPRKKRAAHSVASSAAATAQDSIKPNPTFRPSSIAPHLSQAFASAGHGGDFAALVSEMKEKLIEPSLPGDDASESSEPEEVTTPVTTHMARIPSSSGGATAQRSSVRGGFVNLAGVRPQSRKGPGNEHQTPHQRQDQRGAHAKDGEESDVASALETVPEQHQELSPHTVESNNAPSLTSDSDDDEYRNGSSTGPSSHGSDGEDDEQVDVDVEVEELGREREEHEHRPIVHKNDPELHVSRRVKVKPARRGAPAAPVAAAPVREAVVKPDAPRKRGRPRKVQPK